jgi:hypothetical protein
MKIFFWDGLTCPNVWTLQLQDPRNREDQETCVLSMEFLVENKYLFLASKIFVRKWVHQLSNFNYELVKYNFWNQIYDSDRSHHACKSSDEVIDKWIANSPNLQLLRLPTLSIPPKKQKCFHAANFQTAFLTTTDGTKLPRNDANSSIGQTYCVGTTRDGPYDAAACNVACNHIIVADVLCI